jgi:DNA-binding helix-hairpin-helix protein with protein kinase domain
MFDHLHRPTYSSLVIRDNLERITLNWDAEVVQEEMPILRANWIELQAEYHVYWTSCEMQQRNERIKKWANVYTNL